MSKIVYSPGYGAGWSTWNTNFSAAELCFDEELAELVDNEKFEEAAKCAEAKWPGVYTGGLKKARIEYMEPGTMFRITEYDGYERIEYQHDTDWIVVK